VALWCVVLPLAATPVACGKLARRVAIAPMPSPKALAPSGDGLLNSHLGITEADGLGLAARTGSYHELLSRSRGTPWAITR
jgi:hypothetical protein